MSIQQNFPAISPSLNLNFARSKTLDPRITFSRTSTATRVNEQGLVEVVSADIPRFDHEYDASTGVVKSLGLLVEESRVNYETYTEDPTQWNTSNMVPTGNSITLPTGEVSTTIEYKGETTDANNKFIRPTVSGSAITAGDTWTYSGFYKKGTTNGERYVHIVLQNNTATESTGRRFDFDIGNWASSQSLNGVTVVDSGFEKYPNGWFRIWMTCTFPSASSAVQTFTRLFTNSTSIPYDTSFSLWGTQLEKASFYTSYIPNNTGSTATRNPDNVSMTGDNLFDWYNQSEGTTVIQLRNYNISATSTSLLTYRGTIVPNNSMNYFRQLDSQPVGQIIYEGTLPMNLGLGAIWTTEDLQKHAFFYKKDDSGIARFNDVRTDTSVDIPTVNSLIIGSSTQTYNKFILSQLTYYPRRLTNDQLQNLTK